MFWNLQTDAKILQGPIHNITFILCCKPGGVQEHRGSFVILWIPYRCAPILAETYSLLVLNSKKTPTE